MTPLVFEFTSAVAEKKKLVFSYQVFFDAGKKMKFKEEIILPRAVAEVPQQLLRDLHLILGISYYKFYCPPDIRVPYDLSIKQASFWTTVYRKGLGEFFYRNKIDPKTSPVFPGIKGYQPEILSLDKYNKILLGVGGGKESAVACHLLPESDAFVLETGPSVSSIQKTIKVAKKKKVVLKRHLDQKVFQKHMYNGHVPVSAILAFLGITASVLYKYSSFCVGNEQSSNEGNLTWKKMTINHQWSKTTEFENLFVDYLNHAISPKLKYFSVLRGYSELRIASMLARLPKYWPVFSSCNQQFVLNRRREKWCGHCPKCLFTFLILSAFIKKKDLLKIFPGNLYDKEELLPLWRDLLGLGEMKPFECVGTFKEAQTALSLAAPLYSSSVVVRRLAGEVQKDTTVMKFYSSPNLPIHLTVRGMDKILLLGYGLEGQTTHKYLNKNCPWAEITFSDTDQVEQSGYDIIVKSPGIPLEKVKYPYTTATNLFFSERDKQKIIGITGSKGKSTVGSLIEAMLKQGGKKAIFLGNIGCPMLEAGEADYYILELSSYQLVDIEFSPHIAVLTSLFPEHLTYHKNLENYYQAKKRIVDFQTADDYFVAFNNVWKTKSKNIPLTKTELPDTILPGEHNKKNVQIAATVAELFVSPETINAALMKFQPLPHRLEFVGEFNNILFYDDAISTAPESTIAAIKALRDIDTIFLGGEDRGYCFSQLEKELVNIKNIVLFPDSGWRIKTKKTSNVLRTSSMKEAVQFAYQHTAPGKICLLSMASPSYSLWKNFKEKGEEFQKYVKQLK